MIQLVGVEKRFGHQLLFSDLTWHVRRGERIGLVGPNGAGKTTLLRIMAAEVEPDLGQVVRSRGVRLGLLDQEPEFTGEFSVLEEVRRASPERLAIEEEIEALEGRLGEAAPALLERYGELQDRFEAMGGYSAEADARRVLCGLGFTDAELADPASRFSGGWRMRIALARLLLTRPDVLLLDEPTNHLDLESIVWLEDQLRMWEGAVITVSHDRYHLNRNCERIADLGPCGVTVYVGGYDRFCEQRDEARALLQKKWAQQQQEIAKTERFVERFRYKASKAAAVQSRVKQLEKLDRIEIASSAKAMRGFRFPQPGRSGRIVMEMTAASKAYGDNVVYSGLDLTIERGWRIALVGVNGAGKTTLLRLVAGVLELDTGERKPGHNVNIGYFAQHQLEDLNPALSVMQEMEAVADIQTWPMVRGLLGAFLFSGGDVDKPVGVLSGGEKARLALCKLLLRPVAMLLMDEPTSHLDLESRSSLEDALQRYEGTMVVVSHDRYFINAVCTHVLEVERGGVRWFPGTYDDYLWKKAEEERAAAADQAAGEERLLRTSAGLKARAAPTDRPIEDARARKRREAEERNRIYKATRALRAQLSEVEAEIEAGEARVAEIDADLADPANYQAAAGERARALNQERKAVQERVAASYTRWEQLEEAIAEASEGA